MPRLPPALRPLWPYAKVAYTAGTRAAAPVTRRLSAAHGGYLPARTAVSTEAALGESVVEVRGPEMLHRPAPVGHPAEHPVFAAHTTQHVPRVAAALLPGGRVIGPHAAVVTRDRVFLPEFSPYFGTSRPAEHPVFLHPFPPAPRHVDGRLGVLATRGDANYYHFLLDVLPKLDVARRSGLGSPDRWYAPLATGFQRELLALAGVDTDTVVDSSSVLHVSADELLVPGLPDAHLRTPPWTVDYLRARLLPADVGRVPGRRIYVTRGTRPHNRIVVNEADLLVALEPLGFERVDPGAMSVADQIKTFAEAETIVAPHGAALANLAFASPGARVVELFPPDFVQGCYWKLAACVPGLEYRYLVGRGRTPRSARALRPERMRGVASDVWVDPADVCTATGVAT